MHNGNSLSVNLNDDDDDDEMYESRNEEVPTSSTDWSPISPIYKE